MVDTFKREWRAFAALIVVGTAVYWRALNAFFVSDDFEFLTIVAAARNWLVIFEPLVGRFVRPFVVLMYYGCYRWFGLTPWPYHVASLLPHLLSTCLLYVLGLRLFRERTLAFAAALLFAVFSAHSEAVAWPAGVADPIVAVFLLVSFLCYLRGCEPGAPGRWIAWSALAVVGASFTKEVWVSYPAIVFAHAVLLRERAAKVAWRRAVILTIVTGLMVLLYLGMRQAVFGSVTGGYAGLGTSFGSALWVTEVRAFVLRCFFSAGTWTAGLLSRFDLLVWLLLVSVLAWRARGRDGRVVAFTAVAMMLALAPVLPLTISLSTTESERFTYLATVFSSLFVVATANVVLRQRALVLTTCGCAIGWHAFVLVENTTRWRDAGRLARGIVETFSDGVRHYDPDARQAIFLMNLPDNLDGAYVFRRGFTPAIELFAPDVRSSTNRTFLIATNSFPFPRATTRATVLDGARYRLDVSPGRLIQPRVAPSIWYGITAQTAETYDVAFADTIATGLVFHTSAGRVEYAGAVAGRGLPFGSLDLPADGDACSTEAIRFAGWALDDRAVARITAETVSSDGTPQVLGDAIFLAGTRPDVSALFGWLPNHDRSEWNYWLPCAAVARSPSGSLNIRVVATDSDGQRADIGSRVIRARR